MSKGTIPSIPRSWVLSQNDSEEIDTAIPLSLVCTDRGKGSPTTVPSLLDGLCLQNLEPKFALLL